MFLMGPTQLQMVPTTCQQISLLSFTYIKSFINIEETVEELSSHRQTDINRII